MWWVPLDSVERSRLFPVACGDDVGLQPGFAWIQGVSDEELDRVNARLIQHGAGMRAAEYRELCKQQGVELPAP